MQRVGARGDEVVYEDDVQDCLRENEVRSTLESVIAERFRLQIMLYGDSEGPFPEPPTERERLEAILREADDDAFCTNPEWSPDLTLARRSTARY